MSFWDGKSITTSSIQTNYSKGIENENEINDSQDNNNAKSISIASNHNAAAPNNLNASSAYQSNQSNKAQPDVKAINMQPVQINSQNNINNKNQNSSNIKINRQMIEAKTTNELNDIIQNNQILGINHSRGSITKITQTRKGYCGQCSDAVMQSLKDQGINLAFAKVNPTKEHFFVLSKDKQTIIEPTYKQMFFDSNNTPEQDIALINKLNKMGLKDVFIGSKDDFDKMISGTCDSLDIKNKEKESILANWDISNL